MMDNIKWKDVIGQEELKETLQREVIEPLTTEGKPLRCRSILLYGAPGVGKTYLMQGLGTRVPHYQRIIFCDLVSKWLPHNPGEQVRELFEKAVTNQPSILFLDDIFYRIITPRDGSLITAALLSELDGITSRGDRVVLVGAASEPWDVAAPVLGRFDQLLYVPLPHQAARVDIMRHHLHDTNTAFPDHMLDSLGPLTGGFSPADLSILIRDAQMHPIRKVQTATHYKKVSGPDPDNPSNIVDDLLTPCPPGDVGALEMTWESIPGNKLFEPPVTMDDLKISLSRTRPTINEEELIQLQTFTVPLPQS